MGRCSFCKAKGLPGIDPVQLSDLFQPLLDLYEVCSDENGKAIDVHIQNDWSIFSEFKHIADRKRLLTAICKDRLSDDKKYQPRIEHEEGKIIQWNEFREELKHKNRYFPQNVPDVEHLKNLFEFLTLPENETPKNFYRARIKKGNEKLELSEIGKPPAEEAKNGRANPAGISYFYAASDTDTAIAEVRPSKGDTVTVAHFRTTNSMLMADLRNPKHTISPFELDDDNLTRLCTDMPYLTILGEELSKPILPREADLEYLPSQYLCEFVKHIGFVGMVYKSSLAEGDNYALFDETGLKYIGQKKYKVTDINVNYEKVP